MKDFIKKNKVLIVFILGMVLDSQFGFLEKLITDPFWLNFIKGFGAILLAYLTPEKLGLVNGQKIIGGSNPPAGKDEK